MEGEILETRNIRFGNTLIATIEITRVADVTSENVLNLQTASVRLFYRPYLPPLEYMTVINDVHHIQQFTREDPRIYAMSVCTKKRRFTSIIFLLGEDGRVTSFTKEKWAISQIYRAGTDKFMIHFYRPIPFTNSEFLTHGEHRVTLQKRLYGPNSRKPIIGNRVPLPAHLYLKKKRQLAGDILSDTFNPEIVKRIVDQIIGHTPTN
jgi:hypothetical protein